MTYTTIYIKADQNSVVTNKKVHLQDVVKIYGTDKTLVKKINNTVILVIESQKKCKYAVSILKVIELIQKENPDAVVINVGEEDFVIEYIPPKPKNIVMEWVKTVIVCFIVFFGAAFTIMTFNEDVAVKEVFGMFYKLVMGKEEASGSVMEIAYSIGLPIGVVVFFNHFSKVKIDSDPTPLQVQLRSYEKDINTAIIENKSREGKTIDAG
ncbi:MAG: stage V sporulation protein AA [Lachnospiraceae bacterium]|nr:stage V sporulation protein AA [Lachnospiraceae bacterium]